MKKFLKNESYLFITFILSLITILTIYKLQNVAPLGRNSLLTIDFFHQYGPMLSELFDRIKSGESLIYSFNLGLGIPFFRNFFNYLSSPLNILMFLFNRNNLIMSYSIIIAIRASITSVTMSYFLKKKFDFKNNYIIGLSILYSFSTYFTAYYFNVMWLDGMLLLPLIILGIENIINKNNGILYTISLTLMLYTNYFIAYMICIFSVIYFISYLIIKINKKNIKLMLKRCLKFAICSLLSGMLMCWALIPMFEGLSTTNATTGTMPETQYYAFTLFEFLKNHITGIKPTVFASGISNAPNISCGILIFALSLLFFINKKISLKRKIVYGCILIFLIASFYLAPLDYIWHAFHVPNDLPYRYSFIYSFVLIIISTYSLKYIKEQKFLTVLITYFILMIFITYLYFSGYDNISEKMIYCNYIFLSIYFVIYTLFHFRNKLKKYLLPIFLVTICTECVLSINDNWDILQYIDEFYSSYSDIHKSVEKVKNNDNELFYRTEKNTILTFNDGAWYDYYGQTTFSSMAYNNLSVLNNNLGMPGNFINSYYYKQNTPIYDMMFDIKYTIGNNSDLKRYSEYLNRNDTLTYKFNYNIGLMYGVNNTIKNFKYNYINPLEYQNNFIYNTTNIEDTLYRLNLLNKEIVFQNDDETLVKFTYENISNDNIYFYSNNSLVKYLIIDNDAYYKNDTKLSDIALHSNIDINSYNTYDEAYVINKYINNKTFDIYVAYSNYLNEEIDVYTIDNDKFINAFNILNKNKINITEFKEDTIIGNVNLDRYLSIYTSIPYDNGWSVFVNGKKINTYKIADSLLGFDLNKGKNNIKLVYRPHNIYIWLSISIITLISSILYLIIKKKSNVR